MTNVFVFPACNEPGLEAIRSLAKSNKIRVLGGSSRKGEYDPARHLLAEYVPCPQYDEPGFSESFQQMLRDRGIDVVIPAWDPLVALFSTWRLDGTTFITPRPEIAHLLMSKRATYARLTGVVPVPRTYTPDAPPFPAFAKPDRGSGSRDTLLVHGPVQLQQAVEQGLMLCEYLPGPEYTVDCIGDRAGRLLFANVRLRGVIGRGVAIGTRDVNSPIIHAHVERIAGSMTLTRMCGVNIPLISVFLFTGHPVRVPRPRQGILLNRSLANFVECGEPFDWVIWDWDDTLVRKDGKPDPDAVACLYDLRNRGIRQALLSKNPAVRDLMRTHRIPDFFDVVRQADDKIAAVAALLDECRIDPNRCIMVNDAYSEILVLQDRYPDLRTVTPDALEILGRERVS